ncbi:unnamed protein product [Arctogadus glacialis]
MNAVALTLDPNTAGAELRLSADGRGAGRVWGAEPPRPLHPDRFLSCPQVLGREGLLGSAYWEVACQGGVDVGVAYRSISRMGEAASCLIGHNRASWSLECSDWGLVASHAGRRVGAGPCDSAPRRMGVGPRDSAPRRVGVFLDWPGGALSFYFLSADCRTRLHTFHCSFTQPLFPAFWLWGGGASLDLLTPPTY